MRCPFIQHDFDNGTGVGFKQAFSWARFTTINECGTDHNEHCVGCVIARQREQMPEEYEHGWRGCCHYGAQPLIPGSLRACCTMRGELIPAHEPYVVRCVGDEEDFLGYRTKRRFDLGFKSCLRRVQGYGEE